MGFSGLTPTSADKTTRATGIYELKGFSPDSPSNRHYILCYPQVHTSKRHTTPRLLSKDNCNYIRLAKTSFSLRNVQCSIPSTHAVSTSATPVVACAVTDNPTR